MRYFTDKVSKKAYINIITLCNQKCSYCYARRDLKTDWGKIMTTQEVYEIRDFLKSFKDIEVGIIGGEPTLHPKLKEIIKILDDFHVVIYSNGSKPLQRIANEEYSLTLHDSLDIRQFIRNTYDVKDYAKVKLMLTRDNRKQKETQKRHLEEYGFTVEFRAIDDDFDAYKPEEIEHIGDRYYKEDDYGEVTEIPLKEFNRDFRGFYCEPLVLNFYPSNRGSVNCTDILDNFRRLKIDKFICTKEKCRLCFLEGEKSDHPKL